MFVSVYLVLSFLLILFCFSLLVVFLSARRIAFFFFFVISGKGADDTFVY